VSRVRANDDTFVTGRVIAFVRPGGSWNRANLSSRQHLPLVAAEDTGGGIPFWRQTLFCISAFHQPARGCQWRRTERQIARI